MSTFRLKKNVHKIHLVLGLAIGVPFFIISFSGAILAWKPEFSTVMYKQKVIVQDAPFVPVSKLKATLAEEFPEGDFRSVLFQGKDRTANVLLYVPGTYYYAFMNPYTAEIQHLQNMKRGWLNTLVPLHRNLLLGKIGEHIVHWITLLSLFMIITGLVLWWPKRKSKRKYSFKVQWKARPVKVNYDLHNVFGFYGCWIGVFTILTGIFWGFEPFRDSLKVLTEENRIVYDSPISDVSEHIENQNLENIIDSLVYSHLRALPDLLLRISYPHSEEETINMAIIDPWQRVWRTDYYHFDQYSGQKVKGHFKNGLSKDASSFTLLNRLVYDIHLGNLFGFIGRLMASLNALILASLPITGFFIWSSKRQS
ncbi:PepSY-associated TM helix domain-containing protein [Pareuzebyella sediminis]|uniref:PepSY-associated TM helix domain-containing protein n=1 Tax=Pareuzebyella sediminis TaxID=2607998 RepID=UPI0011EF3164|nr:PepSY-associated TM helix domain-containing protein [Pareuzebyella sediminis]